MAEPVDRLPLFPLGLVLLPTETVPLHIFEERYKLMIGECLDEQRHFGILWLSDDGLREIGCTAAITRLLERMDDGRMNILCEGAQPFRLLRRIEELPYPAGDVELLEDKGPPPEPELVGEARERYADLVARVTDDRPEDDQLALMDAYRMAAAVELPLADKQKLLDERSEEERLRLVVELFETTMKRLDYMERASALARSNGKARG